MIKLERNGADCFWGAAVDEFGRIIKDNSQSKGTRKNEMGIAGDYDGAGKTGAVENPRIYQDTERFAMDITDKVLRSGKNLTVVGELEGHNGSGTASYRFSARVDLNGEPQMVYQHPDGTIHIAHEDRNRHEEREYGTRVLGEVAGAIKRQGGYRIEVKQSELVLTVSKKQ